MKEKKEGWQKAPAPLGNLQQESALTRALRTSSYLSTVFDCHGH